jgi:hypothetical protein
LGEIKAVEPDIEVRLESRLARGEYLDVELRSPLGRTALELKYVTRRADREHQDEPFELADHRALDQRRYDIVKDISRIERYVADDGTANGAVVALTNDPQLWEVPRRAWKERVDAAFRLHEGHLLSGRRSWSSTAGTGTMRGRSAEFELQGAYEVQWRAFAEVPEPFRALVIEVAPVPS